MLRRDLYQRSPAVNIELSKTCCTACSLTIGLLDEYMDEVNYASRGLPRAGNASACASMILNGDVPNL